MIDFDDKPLQIGTIIKIVGVGGAGGNAINTMIQNNLTGVEFIAANTDNSDLNKSKAKMKLQLGKKLTRGLGTGANPETGKQAAEESKDDIKANLDGADMIFIAAGMGGGTGTGASPVIAKIAREMGILTLGIVSTPFVSEGQRRSSNAEDGIKNLREFVDTLIIIPNEKLKDIFSDLGILDAFHKADSVLFEAAKAVSDIINLSGYINVDFADVMTVMKNMGYALMGTGIAEGENRAIHAAKAAIDNPLLNDINLQGCQSLLINVTAGSDMKMSEFDEISSVVISETGSSANTIMGLIIDDNMTGKISVTIIATGLKRNGVREDNVIAFNPTKVTQEIPSPKPDTPTDDIEDIFARLNLNQGNQENKTPAPPQEREKSTSLRTDIPSFLKALD